MKKVFKYTGEKTYMYPSGKLATPEVVLQDFPAVLTFTHIVTTDPSGEVMLAMQNLSVMRNHYGIDAALSEEEAIAAIQEILNAPAPVVEATPTAEERIAAALEYQVMASLPDEDEEV